MNSLPPLPIDFNAPSEWRELDRKALSRTVLLVGATDTGKSTLARWLLEQARNRGRTAAWLDGDLGQSSLGLPGTLNFVTVTEEASAPMRRAAFFVGSSSPKGHMLQVLTGLRRLRDEALCDGADPIFIDTSGLVAEDSGGGALKEWETELLLPTAIIALRRGQELTHLLVPWRHDPRFHLQVLPVASGVRRRTPQERSMWRQQLLRSFFEKTRLLRIGKEQTPIYGWQNAAPGCLAGLIDRQGLLLGAGVVRRILSNSLELLSPHDFSEQLAIVRLGRLRIDHLTGRELPRNTAPGFED